MEPIIIDVKDKSKYLPFLQFIQQLDFVEILKPAKKKTHNEKYDFFGSAGLWAEKDINAKELRTKAWNRQK